MTTDRIYQGDNEDWYFNVRGNAAKGPFPSYHDAEIALNQHVQRCERPHQPAAWPKALRALRVKARPKTESKPSIRA